MKRYLIYWRDHLRDISGNSIVELNPKKIKIMELVNYIIDLINKENPKLEIKSLVIKFMIELK